jgi:hypothetical protein
MRILIALKQEPGSQRPAKVSKSFCHAGSDFPKEQANEQSDP